jgi:hypothetical protein
MLTLITVIVMIHFSKLIHQSINRDLVWQLPPSGHGFSFNVSCLAHGCADLVGRLPAVMYQV